MFGCCCAGGGDPGDPSDECRACQEVGHPRPEWILTLPATLTAQAPECPQSLAGDYLTDWDTIVIFGLDGACQWEHVMTDRLRSVTYPPPLFNGVCGAFNRDLTFYVRAGRMFFGEQLGTPQFGITVIAMAEGSGSTDLVPDAVWRRVGLPIVCDGRFYSIPFYSRNATGLWSGSTTLPAVSVRVVN